MIKILFLLSLIACSLNQHKSISPTGNAIFSYVDVTGSFKLNREKKIIKNQVATRIQLIEKDNGKKETVEKSIMISKAGLVKSGKQKFLTLRPQASEFTVWLDKKKYSNKMNIDVTKKAMKVELKSPDPRWSGVKLYPFPDGKYFCFYNQIPECLGFMNILQKALNNQNTEHTFHVIWDGYPFVQNMLTGVGGNLFSSATIKFDGEMNGLLRYIVILEEQLIIYFFNRDFEFMKLAWISQGITIAPPGQEIVNE